MKKILFVICLISLNVGFGQLTSLNSWAQQMKESDDPNMKMLYSNIRESSVEMWGDNHVMIVSTINQYADSFVNVIATLEDNDNNPQLIGKILKDALEMWVNQTDKSKMKTLLGKGSDDAFYCCKVNWQMVDATMTQQLEAASSY